MPRDAKPAHATSHARVNQRVVLPLILGVLGFLAALYGLAWSGAQLRKLDRELLDQFHLHGRKTPARDDIIILAIDDASLTASSAFEDDLAAVPALRDMKLRFPWPRRVWAQVIDRLVDAGARVIFLDLAFIGEAPEPGDDRILRECLERHKGSVIIGAKFDDANIHGGGTVDLFYPNRSVTGKEVPDDGTWGFLNFWPDPDGIVRQGRFHTTRWKLEKELTPEGEDPPVPDPDETSKSSIALSVARKVNASATADVPETGRLRFCRVDAYSPHSLHHLFVPALWDSAPFNHGAFFRNKIIMVGATAQELQDFQRIPFGVIAGVQLHAHALTALLSQSFVKEAPTPWLWLSLVLATLIAWILVSFARHPVVSLLGMWLITAGAVWLTFLIFNHLDLEVSPLPFVVALNGCGILGLAGNFLNQLRQSRKLARFIQRYHSQDRVAHLLRDREGLFQTLGGVERTVTILFSDVRSFTSLSEGMKPEELVAQLNEYLSGMVERVFVHHGSIDKFIGDAVMALWGSMPEHTGQGRGLKQDALQAVASALAMREALVDLNIGWRARDMPELRFGIGIHQGPVVVGNIGSAPPYERMELTVIGDSVNLCSRLEGLTKEYECDLIVSDAVQEHIRATHLCRPLDFVKVKGKAIPVKIYFVQGPRDGREEPAWWPVYEQAIEAFRAGDKVRAHGLFEQCQAQVPDDKLVNRFFGECG